MKKIRDEIEKNNIKEESTLQETTSKNIEPSVPFLYAPDGIYCDGKYFIYFCLSDGSEGVAVSDQPEGPFKAPVRISVEGIDPAIFIDDDSQAYYYWGQFYLNVAKLNNDMITLDETSKVDCVISEEEHYFHEGASLRKIRPTYYLVYSSITYGKPTALSYATCSSSLGPFQYGGVIINNEYCDPQSWNKHGSIESFNGQWYVFYHLSSRNSPQYRHLCIEPITINDDGTIDEVVMTSQGVGKAFKSEEKIIGIRLAILKVRYISMWKRLTVKRLSIFIPVMKSFSGMFKINDRGS